MKTRALLTLLLLAAVAVTACQPTSTPTIEPLVVEPEMPKLDDTPRLALMSAFGAELENLLAEAEVSQTFVINGRQFHLGTLRGKDVVMFLSGGSMTNAAMTTQQALDAFNVHKLLFSGISGGVSPDIRVGDVYVAERWAEYQENFFVRENPDGTWAPPEWFSAEEPNFGMMFPQPSYSTVQGGEPDEEQAHRWFYADPELLAVAQRVAAEVELARCAGADCLAHQPQIVVGGSAVSGPTFVDNAEYREYVYYTWQAHGLDMESAASAHVLYNNQVPFLFVRSASDLAGGDAGENVIMVFFQLAADNSAMFLLKLIEEIP